MIGLSIIIFLVSTTKEMALISLLVVLLLLLTRITLSFVYRSVKPFLFFYGLSCFCT